MPKTVITAISTTESLWGNVSSISKKTDIVPDWGEFVSLRQQLTKEIELLKQTVEELKEKNKALTNIVSDCMLDIEKSTKRHMESIERQNKILHDEILKEIQGSDDRFSL